MKGLTACPIIIWSNQFLEPAAPFVKKNFYGDKNPAIAIDCGPPAENEDQIKARLRVRGQGPAVAFKVAAGFSLRREE